MSIFRVSEPNVADVDLADLGVCITQNTSNLVLSDQFTIAELVRSADLEAAIIGGDLTVDLDFGTGFTTIAAGDYTNRDAAAAFLNVYEITNENNNEDLVDGTDVDTTGPGGNPLHIHDNRYYTETELGASTGGGLIGADDTLCSPITGPFSTLQQGLDALCGAISSTDLDGAYDNDSDGILNVDGTSKPLDLRSDNVNDIAISRTNGVDVQNALLFDVSSDELCLGGSAVGGLAEIDVRIKTDLVVDGDITFTGTITDTTVDNMNVTNASITLRDGAATGGDADILVERGSTGPDACLQWNETIDRWQVGVVGNKCTIACLDDDEDITGVFCFAGADNTEPNLCLTEKSCATPPSANLGAAGEIPLAMMDDGRLYMYDKSNSRNKWLSIQRTTLVFSGRNTKSNKNEYLWAGRVNSKQTGMPVCKDSTLVGLCVQSNDSDTYDIKVRKNHSATDLATLTVTASDGAQDGTLNVDFDQGDEVQIFLSTSSSPGVTAPVVSLEMACRC